MGWFWFALTVGLIALELATVQLVCVWFALSSMVTAIVSVVFNDLAIGWQVLIFVALSTVLLFATRPFVKKIMKINKEKQATNLDLVIGHEAVVTEDIDNIQGLGAIKINGLIWSARSNNNEKISKDEIVIFKEINGNKAIVERKGESVCGG